MSKRVAVLLVVLVFLGFPGGSIASAGGDPASPAGLERYYRQGLTWSGCADFATTLTDRDVFATPGLQCTRVEVPLDYAQPTGATVRIALLRVPAKDPARRIGSLLINPGGPGASGTSYVANLAGSLTGAADSQLTSRFDLVGFDPRGVGASLPAVTCRTSTEFDAVRLNSDSDTSPAGVAQTETRNRVYAQQCAERSGLALLAHVGTRDVARDLDVLRAVLGDQQLTYYGASYGTSIGTDYAEQFPRSVRAMVLDGAIDPAENPLQDQILTQAGFQKAFDAFVGWCLAQPKCWLDGTPRERANARFQELARPLDQQPLPTGGRPLSYHDVIIGAGQALYSEQDWPLLNLGLARLAEGKGTIMLALADLYYERDQGGYSNLNDAHTAITCVDQPRVTDPGLLQEVDRRTREAAPFLDDGHPPSPARDVCAFWPVPVTSAPGTPQVDGLAPVLVISTTGDPATPYQAGVRLAGELHGRLLTVEGNKHAAGLGSIDCVDTAVSAYLIDLTLPAEGSRCAR